MAEYCEDTIISVLPNLLGGNIFPQKSGTDKFHLIAVLASNHNAIVIRYESTPSLNSFGDEKPLPEHLWHITYLNAAILPR